MEFFSLQSPDKIMEIINQFEPLESSQIVGISEAFERYLFYDYLSPETVPGFRRSQVDGYAVRAQDTFGASTSLPCYLNLKGTLEVHQDTGSVEVLPEECYAISTGGMLPGGCDAVVMVEYTKQINHTTVEITKAVSPGENVIQEDEEIKKGELLASRGTRINLFHVGLFASTGIKEVEVFAPLRVGIISTGNELVETGAHRPPGKVRDVNSYTLSSALKKLGVIPVRYGIVKDDFEALKGTVEKSLAEDHLILISGGSSVGTRDITLKVIESSTQSEIFFHGLALKPGKPTIFARIGKKPVIGLPGQVASVLVSCARVVAPLIRHFYANKEQLRFYHLTAGENIFSVPGREEWVRVKVLRTDKGTYVYPVYGKSAVLRSFVFSEGFLKIPEQAEGIKKDEPGIYIPFTEIF